MSVIWSTLVTGIVICAIAAFANPVAAALAFIVILVILGFVGLHDLPRAKRWAQAAKNGKMPRML